MSIVKIASTTEILKANTAIHLLNEAGIECFQLNKTDSSYGLSLGGTIELYVDESHVSKALEILEQHEVLSEESE